MLKTSILLLSLLTGLTHTASATDYYVDATGITPINLSIPVPVTEVSQLFSLLSAIGVPIVQGDRIILLPGTYQPFTLIDQPDITLLGQQAVIDLTTGMGPASIKFTSPGQHNGTGIVVEGFHFLGGSSSQTDQALIISEAGPTIKNCQFTDCTAGGSIANGGAINAGWNASSTISKPVRIEDCEFTRCATDGNGGAINAHNAWLQVADSTFTDNQSSGGDGGAVAFTDYDPLGLNTYFSSCRIVDSVFSGNSSSNRGGAVYVEGPVFCGVAGSKFESNFAESSGGAIHLEEGGSFHATRSYFGYNRADDYGRGGGAICAVDTRNAHLSHSTFDQNKADNGYGGGVCYTQSDVDFAFGNSMINCLLDGNTAQYGGAIFADAAYPHLETCTVSFNHASQTCGGFSTSNTSGLGSLGAVSSAYESIFWGNTDGSGVTDQASEQISHHLVPGGATFWASNCDWQGGILNVTPGYNGSCINLDPLFVSSSNVLLPWELLTNRYLDPASPCVDAGSSQAPSAGWLGTTDTLLAADIGAHDIGYHYNISTSGHVLNTNAAPPVLGTPVSMGIYAGFSQNARVIFLTGSVSGTSPGTAWGTGVVDLVFDAYSQFILNSGTGFFVNPSTWAPMSSTINLPAGHHGYVSAGFNVPAGLWPLPGSSIDVWHAYVILEESNPGVFTAAGHSNTIKHTLRQ